jgi:predicted membrane channel-forming protein YqfA (hemolysin III family)
MAHSQPVTRWGAKLDYLGITVLITGSFFPSIYYGFYCFPNIQKVYWTMVYLRLCIIDLDLISRDLTYLCNCG